MSYYDSRDSALTTLSLNVIPDFVVVPVVPVVPVVSKIPVVSAAGA